MSYEDNVTLPLLKSSSPNSYSGMEDSSNYNDSLSSGINESFSAQNDRIPTFSSVSTNKILTIKKGKPKSYVSSPSSIASQRECKYHHLKMVIVKY